MQVKKDIQYILDENLGATMAGIHVAIILFTYAALVVAFPLWAPFYILGRWAESAIGESKEPDDGDV